MVLVAKPSKVWLSFHLSWSLGTLNDSNLIRHNPKKISTFDIDVVLVCAFRNGHWFLSVWLHEYSQSISGDTTADQLFTSL